MMEYPLSPIISYETLKVAMRRMAVENPEPISDPWDLPFVFVPEIYKSELESDQHFHNGCYGGFRVEFIGEPTNGNT